MNYKSMAVVLLLIFSISACNNDNNSGSHQDINAFLEEQFKNSDLNGDGIVNGDELDADIMNSFNTMDTNKDGVITEDDHVGAEYLGEPVKKEQRAELVCDLNDDEILTAEENMQCLKDTTVKNMDLDGDGGITLEELTVFTIGRNGN